VEGLIALGRSDLARTALRLPAALQRGDGAIPVLPGEHWISTAGLAHLAGLMYELDSPDGQQAADRALAALVRRQRKSGAFPGSWGFRAAYFPDRDRADATRLFLEAVRRQAECAGKQDAVHFPAEIRPSDRRWQAVLNLLEGTRIGSRIVDVGCGKGRFLRRLTEQYPHARLCGIDVSNQALCHLPPTVEARQGNLLRLPAADGEFDAALCVEALEHALLPRRAITELCRIVRPGGRLLIIDKNLRFQPFSDHRPWERWFDREEVCHWLAVQCDEIAVESIAHGAGQRSRGLFWCWTARRRAEARSAAA
jgi:malonyl-CoA O-methyltransferase